MDARARFAAAVAGPDIRLDEAAFAIASVARPALDIDDWCGRLDEIARGCPPSFDGIREHLANDLAFRGNVDDYADPENSYLDAVITRRTGIPITLSVLMMEIGRRVGVAIDGVGMPGHFLVSSRVDETWCDPFHGFARLDADGCRRVFDRVYGGRAAFNAAFLAPTHPRSILGRMLTNLEHGPLATEPTQLARVCDLHLAIPELSAEERARLSRLRAAWN
jgi:regulator of sirC expression with transglutaminase-like and TPR domain